jgi:hypothetical protein
VIRSGTNLFEILRIKGLTLLSSLWKTLWWSLLQNTVDIMAYWWVPAPVRPFVCANIKFRSE